MLNQYYASTEETMRNVECGTYTFVPVGLHKSMPNRFALMNTSRNLLIRVFVAKYPQMLNGIIQAKYKSEAIMIELLRGRLGSLVDDGSMEGEGRLLQAVFTYFVAFLLDLLFQTFTVVLIAAKLQALARIP